MTKKLISLLIVSLLVISFVGPSVASALHRGDHVPGKWLYVGRLKNVYCYAAVNCFWKSGPNWLKIGTVRYQASAKTSRNIYTLAAKVAAYYETSHLNNNFTLYKVTGWKYAGTKYRYANNTYVGVSLDKKYAAHFGTAFHYRAKAYSYFRYPGLTPKYKTLQYTIH